VLRSFQGAGARRRPGSPSRTPWPTSGPGLRRQYDALRSGDPAAAPDHILMTAENAVRALERRRIFAAGPAPSAAGPASPAATDPAAARDETRW
jgi:hypothetical protein